MPRVKKVPNPNGKKGCKEHQLLIEKMIEYLRGLGWFVKREHKIILPDNKKRCL